MFDKTIKALIARLYYKENYLKPNSDPGTFQMHVYLIMILFCYWLSSYVDPSPSDIELHMA